MNEYQLAIDRLRRRFGLPPGDPYTQDWVYELPEAYRTDSCFKSYLAEVDALESPQERSILMALLMDIANDRAKEATLTDSDWTQLAQTFRTEADLDLLRYWACAGDELEDAFAISERVRALLERMLTDN